MAMATEKYDLDLKSLAEYALGHDQPRAMPSRPCVAWLEPAGIGRPRQGRAIDPSGFRDRPQDANPEQPGSVAAGLRSRWRAASVWRGHGVWHRGEGPVKKLAQAQVVRAFC